MTEPLGDPATEAPDENRYEVTFYAEGVVDRSNEQPENEESP